MSAAFDRRAMMCHSVQGRASGDRHGSRRADGRSSRPAVTAAATRARAQMVEVTLIESAYAVRAAERSDAAAEEERSWAAAMVAPTVCRASGGTPVGAASEMPER